MILGAAAGGRRRPRRRSRPRASSAGSSCSRARRSTRATRRARRAVRSRSAAARNNDVPLPEDEYASTRHARFEPRRDGVCVEDIGSTNGTFVNGIRLTRERRLAPGDVVRIGETDLRFEP